MGARKRCGSYFRFTSYGTKRASIFLCLLFSQKGSKANIAAALVAVLGVFLCKCIGLSGPAILIGALLGVVAGIMVSRKERGSHVVE